LKNYNFIPEDNKHLVVKGSPVNPQNLGFRCWCVDKEGTTPWNFKDPVTKSMTLYAKWEARYEVNYYDGATLLHKANVFPGEKAERRDSDVVWKKILGWYTDAAMTKEYDFGASVNDKPQSLRQDAARSVPLSSQY